MPNFRFTNPHDQVNYAVFEEGLNKKLSVDQIIEGFDYMVRLVINERKFDSNPIAKYAEDYRVRIARIALPKLATVVYFGDFYEIADPPAYKVAMNPLQLDTNKPMRWRTLHRSMKQDGEIVPRYLSNLAALGPQGYFMEL